MGLWLKMVLRILVDVSEEKSVSKNKDLGDVATPEGNVTRKQVHIFLGDSKD